MLFLSLSALILVVWTSTIYFGWKNKFGKLSFTEIAIICGGIAIAVASAIYIHIVIP